MVSPLYPAPNGPRRVVTGERNGKSVLVCDGPAPTSHYFGAVPGMMTSIVYVTAGPPTLPQSEAETAPVGVPVLPSGPGESVFMIVSFPPDSTFFAGGFDPAAAGAEQMEHIPELVARMDPNAPGMHSTDTVDFAVVLEGEITLELDDGVTTELHQGDIVVQCATRHAWRNASDRPATLSVVLIGGQR